MRPRTPAATKNTRPSVTLLSSPPSRSGGSLWSADVRAMLGMIEEREPRRLEQIVNLCAILL